MKRLLKFGFALGALAGIAVSADMANADTISFGVVTGNSPTNSAPGTVLATGSGTALFNGAVDQYSITTSGHQGTYPNVFDSLDFTTASSGAGYVYIWVTAQDITFPISSAFLAQFTSNLVPAGATLTEQAWLDPSNGLFTTVDSLGSATFTAPGAPPSTLTSISSGGDYSITEVFGVHFTQAGDVQGNIDVQVPGPVLGAGLPGLLAACGGLIALARRRRRKAA